MPVKIKICGVRSGEDAVAALAAGADFFGLVFYEKSPRFVTREQAEEIIAYVREQGFESARAIGVFVNEPPATVMEYVRRLGFFAAQIHGDEPPEYFRDLAGCRVIRTIRIKEPQNLEALGRGEAWAWLCEAHHPEQYGGMGKRIDASLLAPYVSRHRIFLAGGLTPENIAGVLQTMQPYAVDVSSGVESAPGKKDHDKVRAVIAAVRQYDVSATSDAREAVFRKWR